MWFHRFGVISLSIMPGHSNMSVNTIVFRCLRNAHAESLTFGCHVVQPFTTSHVKHRKDSAHIYISSVLTHVRLFTLSRFLPIRLCTTRFVCHINQFCPSSSVLPNISIGESIYDQHPSDPKQIDTKGFLTDFGSIYHVK